MGRAGNALIYIKTDRFVWRVRRSCAQQRMGRSLYSPDTALYLPRYVSLEPNIKPRDPGGWCINKTEGGGIVSIDPSTLSHPSIHPSILDVLSRRVSKIASGQWSVNSDSCRPIVSFRSLCGYCFLVRIFNPDSWKFIHVYMEWM